MTPSAYEGKLFVGFLSQPHAPELLPAVELGHSRFVDWHTSKAEVRITDPFHSRRRIGGGWPLHITTAPRSMKANWYVRPPRKIARICSSSWQAFLLLCHEVLTAVLPRPHRSKNALSCVTWPN